MPVEPLMSSETVLSGFEPRACWPHLEALTRIARPSRHEEAVIEHVRRWADGNGFEAPHSPDERVSIPTVARFWRLLTGVVDELSAVEPRVAAKQA